MHRSIQSPLRRKAGAGRCCPWCCSSPALPGGAETPRGKHRAFAEPGLSHNTAEQGMEAAAHTRRARASEHRRQSRAFGNYKKASAITLLKMTWLLESLGKREGCGKRRMWREMLVLVPHRNSRGGVDREMDTKG